MQTSNSNNYASSSHGWDLRSASGGVIIFSARPEWKKKINLQREDSKAKPYQVRQVRNLIVKYKLGGEL